MREELKSQLKVEELKLQLKVEELKHRIVRLKQVIEKMNDILISYKD